MSARPSPATGWRKTFSRIDPQSLSRATDSLMARLYIPLPRRSSVACSMPSMLMTGTISFLNQPLLDKAGEIKNSKTGKAFFGKLALTLEMSELNGNEKYCYGLELPRADKHYDSIAAGDLMLYSGNCVVLFYGSAGGYSYTRIGKLTSTAGLKDALGTGSISVSFTRE